ncbi:MAG: hypothetical protein NZP34_13880 [Caldilineales bacterium]|nr:hypothetical protein [Caldilineales bacterium]MCX7853994.1 hypothetical protein [Caldilineales bacterium]
MKRRVRLRFGSWWMGRRLPSATVRLRRCWQEARRGQTRPLSRLWEGTEAA